jgi:IS30 family transposase
MGQNYEQLSLEDRCEIARLSANGSSVRQIAAALDRSPSTVSRELKRNRGAQVGYKPGYAQQQTRARRWKGSRLERDESLRAAVMERLASGWSPEQIAGRLKREQRRKVISYESIYRFIYAQLARTKDYRWRHYLPRGKSKRGCRGRKGGGSPNFIEGRVSVANRPIEAADRTTCGHWEADLMMFAKIRPGDPDRSRAQVPPPAGDPVDQQGGAWRRPTSRQSVRQFATTAPSDRYLRQRHRVRPPPLAAQPGDQDLLL